MIDHPSHGADTPSSLVERFVADGYVRIVDAFPRSIADQCRTILKELSAIRDGTPAPTSPGPWVDMPGVPK